MKLEFTNVRMKLASVTARSENHGEEKEPASDLKFEFITSNDVLSQLDPSLKSTFYHYDGARQDLSDKGKEKEPGFLPHLKHPKMAGEQKWNDAINAAHIAIVVPGDKKAIEITEGKVNNVVFTPKEGGSVEFGFRFQYKPDEKVLGKLGMLVQQEVDVTLSAAEETQASTPA